MPKRSRDAPGASKRKSNKRVYKKPRRSVVPGYTRSDGFYGRYSGSAPEQKFLDTSNSFNFDATGEVPATGQLALIPQGATESTRVGRKCTIKSIQINGNLLFTPTSVGLGCTVAFLALVLDKQTNGAAAAFSDVFVGSDGSRAVRNLANADRFVVLKKWSIPINSTAGDGAAFYSSNKNIKYYKKCKIPMVFNGATGAITEIRSNNIFLLASSFNTDDLTQFLGTTRIRFSDD